MRATQALDFVFATPPISYNHRTYINKTLKR
jgi:hypothetical protein